MVVLHIEGGNKVVMKKKMVDISTNNVLFNLYQDNCSGTRVLQEQN